MSDLQTQDSWSDGAGANPYDPPRSINEPRRYWRAGLLAATLLLLSIVAFTMLATFSGEESVVVPDVQVYEVMVAD